MEDCKVNLAKSFKIYHTCAQMQPHERQHRIGEYLQKVEFASLEEISAQVNASPSTVRRDLAVLEATGGVQRTHGGGRGAFSKFGGFTLFFPGTPPHNAKKN